MITVLVQPKPAEWKTNKDNSMVSLFRLPPIGLLSIAAYMEEAGREVYVYDSHGPYAAEEIQGDAETILSYRPDIVGITSTTSTFSNAYALAQEIKVKSPDTLVAAGGVHVTSTGESILSNYPLIDYVCMHEGEKTMADIASGLKPEEIPGIIRRSDENRIIANPPREYIPNLDELPFPAYHKLQGFPGKYTLPVFNYCDHPVASILTSRGCPFKCTFCDRSVFGNRFRANSPEYVYNHMLMLRKGYGVKHISIYDDLFTVNRKRITDICEKLIKNPIGVRFNCLVRVGNADSELLRMLKRAGCYMVSLGIETGDPELINEHKPGVSLEGVRKSVNMIKSHGLRVKGLFIMGLPGETRESVKGSSDFIMSLNLDMLNVSKFSPFPGAALWKEICGTKEFENNPDKLNCMNFVYLPENMGSKEEMERLYSWMIKRFYKNPFWIIRIVLRTWEYRHSIIHFIKNIPMYLKAKKEFE